MVLGAVLAGCTPTPVPDEEVTDARQDAAPPSMADPGPDPTSPIAPTSPPDSTATEPPDPSGEQLGQDCDDGQRTELTAAVDGQLDAIAARDWEQALSFATDAFRADIDPDRFRDIILDGLRTGTAPGSRCSTSSNTTATAGASVARSHRPAATASATRRRSRPEARRVGHR